MFAALALAAVVSSTHPTGSPAPGGATFAEQREDSEVAPSAGSRFKCQAGGDLIAHFETHGPRLIAVVDAGDGPHALPIRPWDGGPVLLTWSDGVRTLTWSPGVQIMWMDGGEHRMCGGGMHHEH